MDEPFDELLGSSMETKIQNLGIESAAEAVIPMKQESRSSPPPPAAFKSARAGGRASPPAAAFKSASSGDRASPPAAAFMNSSQSQLGTSGGRASPPASAFSQSLPERWNHYEKEMEAYREESAITASNAAELAAAREIMNTTPMSTATTTTISSTTTSDQPSWKKKYEQIKAGMPQQTTPRKSFNTDISTGSTPSYHKSYGFRRSESDTSGSRIRSFNSRNSSGSSEDGAKVREEAMKVMHLVDDKLNSPVDVRRTDSGGFRVGSEPYTITRTDSGHVQTQSTDPTDPYSVSRTTSGGLAKKRVPSALAGLDLGRQANPNSNRFSFRDRSYRDDASYDNVDEEDNIVHDLSFNDEVLDIVNLENRAAGSRVIYDEKVSDDGPIGGKSWSSRYSVERTLFALSGGKQSSTDILDQVDREANRERTSARNMFFASANSIKVAAQESTGKVFGSGFSFRQNHLFGKQQQQQQQQQPERNLQTVWKDSDDHSDGTDGSGCLPPPPPIHKTWHQAMLNKRRRRRTILAVCICLLCLLVVVTTMTRVRSRSTEQDVVGTIIGDELSGPSVTFYVTSDVPYSSSDEDKIKKDLANIPGDAEFIVHLGNIQDAPTSFCPATRYSNVASILEASSPVPMLALPGEHDWSRCPRPQEALEHWKEEFVNFEDRFSHNYRVLRQNGHEESFCMLHNGVLFLGLHLVGGPVFDADEWSRRDEDMLRFSFGMLNMFEGEFRALVILGNARPGPQQDEFWRNFIPALDGIGLPVVYIHANYSGDGMIKEYYPFPEFESIKAMQIEDGGKNPPLRVKVAGGESPFILG